MTLTRMRDFLFLLYFFVVSFSYLFLVRSGEKLDYYLYLIFLIGAALVFVICLVHIIYVKFGVVNKFFAAGFFLLSFSAISDLVINKDSNVLNMLFFLVFAWSFYDYPIARFRVFINSIFIVAVVWSIVSYYLGLNVWGFFPGQATTNLSQGLWWRVGLFPFQNPPFSGAFSLGVFLANFRIQTLNAKMISIIAFYFFLFSGSRAVFVAFLACLFIFIIRKNYRMGGMSMISFLVALISVLMIISNAPYILRPFLGWSDFLSSLVLRIGDSSQNEVVQDARSVIFFHFLDYIYASWPLGAGANGFLENYQGPGGSEMPGVRVVAESGVFGLLAIISLAIFSFMKGVGAQFFVVIFFVLLFFYGSFLHPYSPVFLILLSFISCSDKGSGQVVRK